MVKSNSENSVNLALDVSDLSKQYEERMALSHASFAIPLGTICGFVGPNGAGKTTTISNNDLNIALAAPRKSLTEYFYKNADADELLFVHQGTGVSSAISITGCSLFIASITVKRFRAHRPILCPRLFLKSPFADADSRSPGAIAGFHAASNFPHPSCQPAFGLCRLSPTCTSFSATNARCLNPGPPL